MSRKKQVNKAVAIAWFFLYLMILAFLMFFIREREAHPVNLIPLNTIKHFCGLLRSKNYSIFTVGFINIVGNIFMFIPLGVFLPAIFKAQRKWYILFPCASVFISFLEYLQYATALGTADIDDLILNLIGVLIGYILYRSSDLGKHQ